LVITYIIDLEQLVVADPSHFSYPVWPPGPAIDLVHWWGTSLRSVADGPTAVSGK